VSSDTRSPVCTATVRGRDHADRSGSGCQGGEQGVDLVVGEEGHDGSLRSLVGNSKHLLDESRELGWRRAAYWNIERIAASLALRVRTELCRSCSRWAKKAVISWASRSARSRAEGRFPSWS